MKRKGLGDLENSNGALMLLYGDSGVGKSVTSLQTCPMPILYIMTEPRNVKNFVVAADREGLEAEFAFYEDWEDTMEFMHSPSNFKPFKSVVIDSLSHLIAINLSDEILDESFNAMVGSDVKAAKEKPLTMRAKMSQEGYGTLGTQMLRFTAAACQISQHDKVVVCLARMDQNPRFNKMLAAAPTLEGQKYSKHMPGFFDFIGYVETRVDKDGNVVYPPLVSFESDGSIMAKWTGRTPEGGVANRILHVEKILDTAFGKR